MLVKRADCIVAISPEIKRALAGFGVPPDRIQSIPNGTDPNQFCPLPRDRALALRGKLSLATDRVIVVYTGRLIGSKGLPLLLEVWNELVAHNKDIQLVLVGTGEGSHDSCESELRTYVKLHSLKDSVLFTGEVSNVHEYLQASDIFVFPSEHEGFSLSLVEALACGLPSVVTSVGVASELIENYKTGILVNPKDKEGLKGALDWLLHHKEKWPAMKQQARQRGEQYSMEVIADRYHALFLRLHWNEALPINH